jgi:hypothetical protein
MSPLTPSSKPALANRQGRRMPQVENEMDKLAPHHNEVVAANKIVRPGSDVLLPFSPFHSDAPRGIMYLT